MHIDKLIAGYYRFHEGYVEENRQRLAEVKSIDGTLLKSSTSASYCSKWAKRRT